MIFTLGLAAATQFGGVEFVGGVEPIYIMEEPEGFSSSGLNELMGMVEQMQQTQQQQYHVVQNPCINDQVRLRCGPDAACLKAHLSQLAPSCAMFLLKNTKESRPSPSPAPSPAPMSGFYSEIYLGQDGQMHAEEGRLSSREGKKLQGGISNLLDVVLSEFLGEPQPPMRSQTVRQPQAVPAPRPSKSSHPCEDEVNRCREELNGVTTREPMLQCLVKRYAGLSSECKCFLHQVMGEELERAVPAAKSSSEPRMPSVAVAEDRVTGSLVFLRETGPSPPGHHRITCALFMMLFFLSVALVLHRLCFCCVEPKPRFAAVVPPQQLVQMTVEPLVAKHPTTAKM